MPCPYVGSFPHVSGGQRVDAPMPEPGLGPHTESRAKNLLAREKITMDGYSFQAQINRIAPVGLVPGGLRSDVGFTGTLTGGPLTGAPSRASTTC